MTQTGMARKLRHDERYQSLAGQRARPRVGFIGWSKTLCYVTGGAAWASTEYNAWGTTTCGTDLGFASRTVNIPPCIASDSLSFAEPTNFARTEQKRWLVEGNFPPKIRCTVGFPLRW